MSSYFVLLGFIFGLLAIYSIDEEHSFPIAASMFFLGALMVIRGHVLNKKEFFEIV